MKLVAENQIIVYKSNATVRLDVRLENETVWLMQQNLADTEVGPPIIAQI